MAPKAGNVHPAQGFGDVTWQEFIVSAMAIRPILDSAAERGVGATVLDCVKQTRAAVAANTNLGIVLLLAPLCAVPLKEDLATGLDRVLNSLSDLDTQLVFEAIRTARPGGLGAAVGDVHKAPTVSLRQAMQAASDRDAVARQYADGFSQILEINARAFAAALPLDQSIVRAHLEQMAREPDSLIRRKCGLAVAVESQRRARQVLDANWPEGPEAQQRFVAFDSWLRTDGNRRNPGTSADLVVAGLFVALREGTISLPIPWSNSLSMTLS